MALICVLDDGREDGHWIRVHADRFTIGRSDADFVLPHEGRMSSRHFELRREIQGGRFRWHLKDLDTSNGTFARVSDAILRDGQEVLVGATRFRFNAGAESPAVKAVQGEGHAAQRDTTQQWPTLPTGGLSGEAAALVELINSGEGRRFPLIESPYWIGADKDTSSIVVEDDPFVDPQHANIWKDDRGSWHVKNNDSLNGTWVQIEEVTIEKSGMFQAGEQRFLIALP